jgi:hypothetical protein
VSIVIDFSVSLKQIFDDSESEAAMTLPCDDLIAPLYGSLKRQMRFGVEHVSASSRQLKRIRV